ncbi:hypothetical protein [Streptomyces sp. IBSBF 2806]|uniref:hypothetical protein n=1 Tax=Streptomyces sp. IBSBF 2806 TaxID=2903529 RepID=UPI002FDB9D1A
MDIRRRNDIRVTGRPDGPTAAPGHGFGRDQDMSPNDLETTTVPTLVPTPGATGAAVPDFPRGSLR